MNVPLPTAKLNTPGQKEMLSKQHLKCVKFMPKKFNYIFKHQPELIYSQGFLPQRNDKKFYYLADSCRSNLTNFRLTSENKRIIKTTAKFDYQTQPLTDFNFTSRVQKQCLTWVKKNNWDFPVSSIKNVFVNHIFNQLYIWSF